MSADPDLPALMRSESLHAYEHDAARHAYAYGVALRRARWLSGSSVGNALVRAVDRQWAGSTQRWLSQDLESNPSRLHTPLLHQLDSIVRLLHAQRPTIKIARDRRNWPWATPLAPPHGCTQWLVLDHTALNALDSKARAFALGSAVGHLQCGHGIFFAAHRMVAYDRPRFSAGLLKRALRPWTALLAFSSDRAGLLACGDLEVAIDTVGRLDQLHRSIDWLPRPPALAQRTDALREFDQTITMARVRAGARVSPAPLANDIGCPLADDRHTGGDHPLPESVPVSERPPPVESWDGVPDSAWPLARCDRRLTERLGLF